MQLHNGDCVAYMREIPADYFHAIITDPPYGLGYLGKRWDAAGLEWAPAWAEQAFRVLRPGGYCIAAGGARTVHRLTCALEDAGLEIRDQIVWCYWNGTPKGSAPGPGLGHTLSGAWEPFIMARKPLREGNVLANMDRYGVGALNIDACRVSPGHRSWPGPSNGLTSLHGRQGVGALGVWSGKSQKAGRVAAQLLGRYPGNLYHCPKPGTAERERGCSHLPLKTAAEMANHTNLAHPNAGAGRTAAGRHNHHPTLKPVELGRHLVRLVTPPGGLVLDTFAGSGSLMVAAELEGREACGCETEPDYCEIIQARMTHARLHPASWAHTDPGGSHDVDDWLERAEAHGQLKLVGGGE